jgi:hypothetical protein
MGEDSQRFRQRAIQCRILAKDARDAGARQTLNQMGEELDEEADRLDAEEVADAKIIEPPRQT